MTLPAPADDTAMTPPRPPRPSPLGRLLDVLASVRLGIVLLSLLFIYSAVGSAGILVPIFDGGLSFRHEMVRQWRLFELTEFEWFHTPVFVALCALICVNLTVATLRRIPFNLLKLGVWMIHTGIIILAIGSVWYFATKVEGDTPVLRRQIVVTTPDGATASMPAVLGREVQAGDHRVRVIGIDPTYDLLTDGYQGTTDFAVRVMVTTPAREFVRQILAAHPQFTEDVVPGEGRVKNIERFGGRALLDDELSIRLATAAQDAFWVKDTWALHVRRAGEPSWADQRIISGLPRYNDYVDDGATWDDPPAHELDLSVATADAEAPDALAAAGVDVHVTGYLRYAFPETRRIPGGDVVNPIVDVEFRGAGGRGRSVQLAAYDPGAETTLEGLLELRWITSDREVAEERARAAPGRLRFRLAGEEAVVEASLAASDRNRAAQRAQEIGETGWSWRLVEVREQGVDSFIVIELLPPEGGRILRGLSADPTQTMDIVTSTDEQGPATLPPDERIDVRFEPAQAPPYVIVAGAGDLGVRLLQRTSTGAVIERPMQVGRGLEIGEGFTIRVTGVHERSRVETKPRIVPPEQRDRDVDRSHGYAMARLELSAGNWRETLWMSFHRYTFDSAEDVFLGFGRYEPSVVELPDGTEVELIFGRERRPLPAEVVLEDFELTSHVGGFTGTTGSIRNWTSQLRFREGDGAWSEPLLVRVNEPRSYGGYSYFQSFWDPPRSPRNADDPGSPGMTFTGLGIGNRHGVWTSLFGATLSVIGMAYAFYVKPVLRRRRIEAARLRGAATQEVEELA